MTYQFWVYGNQGGAATFPNPVDLTFNLQYLCRHVSNLNTEPLNGKIWRPPVYKIREFETYPLCVITGLVRVLVLQGEVPHLALHRLLDATGERSVRWFRSHAERDTE